MEIKKFFKCLSASAILLFSLFFSATLKSYAEEVPSETMSMRHCMLLPINDKMDGALGFKVFEEVEDYLKHVNWCIYKSNSESLNVLRNYQKNLPEHLKNPEIIKTLTKKIKAGSVIKIELNPNDKGIDLSVDVIGANGEDLYFSEKEFIEEINIDKIVQNIRILLGKYRRFIPYEGTVEGTLGKQITIDSGKLAGLKIGQNFEIKREKNKVFHPLLKKIVSFETETLAQGQIVSITEFQSVGIIKDMEAVKRIHKKDWVVIAEKTEEKSYAGDMQFPKIQGYEFGKLGMAGINLILGDGENASMNNGRSATIGGIFYGLGGSIEAWATRNYYGKFEIEKSLSTYKPKEGRVSKNSNSVSMSLYKLYGGFRYLPLGFFYGPFVDIYLGYGYYSYEMDTSVSDGFGSAAFHGILIGTQGNLPIYQQLRIFARGDILFRPSYEEDIKVHGTKNSSFSYMFELGTSYEYDTRTQVVGSISRVLNQAKFENPSGENTFTETKLKLGLLFTF